MRTGDELIESNEQSEPGSIDGLGSPPSTNGCVLLHATPSLRDQDIAIPGFPCIVGGAPHDCADGRSSIGADRWHELLDALPAAIYTTNAQGRLTHFNRACSAISGRTPELGTDYWCVTWKLYHPDGRPMRHDECPMAIVLKEGRVVRGAEAIAERPDGTRIWFTSYPTPLLDEAGNVVGGINMLVDITDRKRAEEANARLAAIVESSDDAIVTKSLDGVITGWNAAAERLFGYTAKEAIGQPVTMLMPPDRVNEEPGILERIRRGERIDHYETVRRRKDGSLLDISLTVSPVRDAHGRIVGASKVARDVTERRKAEQALRASEDRLACELRGMNRLHELGLHLAEKKTLEEVMAEVMTASGELLGAKRCTAQLMESTGNLLRLVAATGFDEEFADRFRTVTADGFTTCAAALGCRRRVVVEDLAARPEFVELAALTLPMGIRAVMSTPLLASDGELLGLFTNYWDRPHAPSEHELRLLDLYVQQAARQVERRAAERAIREGQEQLAIQVADLETLRRLSLRVAAAGDRTTALNDVLDTAITLVGAAKANVQLYDAADDTLKIIAHRGFNDEFLEFFRSVPMGYSCCGTAMRQRDRIIIEDVYADERFRELADTYARHGFRAVQSTPLFTSDGRLLGMFSTHFAHPYRPSERDLRVLDQIAQQAGRVIERASAEQALRESEGRFRMIADNISQLAWTCDQLGNVTWYNQRWLEYTGLSFEAMKDWGWTKCHHPDHVDRVVESVTRARNSGELWEDTFPLRGKDGNYRWFLSRAVPIRDDGGCIKRWFGTNTDITAQLEAEEGLRRHKEELEEVVSRRTAEVTTVLERLATSQRLAAVGTLAAGLAHDMNNLLMPLGLRLDALRTGKPLRPNQSPPPIHDDVRAELLVISALLDHLRDLSRNLSLFSRDPEKEGIVGRTTIVQWAASVHKLLDASVGREIVVQWDCPAPGISLPDAAIAPHRLTQAVQNLMHNARDAVLAAKAADPGRMPRIAVRAELAKQNPPFVALSVSDNGVGMDAETQRRAIEPFFTTRDRPDSLGSDEPIDPAVFSRRGASGTGLGLSLAHQIAERAGGSLEIESRPGQGTTITLLLPVASSTEGQAHA